MPRGSWEGRKLALLHVRCFRIRHFPLCPGSQVGSGGAHLGVEAPWELSPGLQLPQPCGPLTPFQLGCQRGSDPSVATSWLCDVGKPSLSLHLCNGPRKAPLPGRQKVYAERVAPAPAYPWRCPFPAVGPSRPGRGLPTPPPGLPLGCVPTWSHLTPEAPSIPSPCLWDVLRAPHTLKPLGPPHLE